MLASSFVETTIFKVIVVAVVVIIFLVVTIINLKIKKPEGCENEIKECDTCSFTCIHNTNKEKKDE